MKISRNTVVKISFVVSDDKNQVVGRTDPKNPLEILVGRGQLIKGLDLAIDGHEKGDEFTVTLNPADAYGVYDDSLVQEVPRSNFGDMDLEVGAVFEAETNNGNIAVVIKEIKDDIVVVDGNHPLSGKVLNFLVTIEDVREATADEIEHGHAHPQGACPSEAHTCGCGCGHHHEDHECCGGHHHEDHECCGGHHHEDHECCGGHHHEDHECCGGHHHEEDHHCCCGRH